MSSPFTGDTFKNFRSGISDGWPANAIWEGVEKLRTQFDKKATPTTSTRDVRAAVLALLAEKALHGFEIITEIEERSGGSWKPNPGSVYPTLQLLADEGLVIATETDGRKIYSLTVEGRRVADAAADTSSPWQASTSDDSPRASALPKAGISLAQATAEVGRSGNPAQVKQAVEVLEEARRKLYSILAQD